MHDVVTLDARCRPYLSVFVAAMVSWFAFGYTYPADLAVFLKAAGQVLHGVNPYTPTDSPALLDGHAYVYPWLVAFAFIPLTLIPEAVGMLAFFVVSLMCVVAGSRILGLPAGLGTTALILSVAFSRNVELGAVNAIFFFLLSALWHWRNTTWVVVVCATALVGAKLFLAPILLWVVLTRSLRTAALTLGTVAAFFWVNFLLGPSSATAYFRALGRLSDHMQMRGFSFTHTVQAVFPGLPTQTTVRIVCAAVLLLAVTAHAQRGRDSERFLLACCVSIGLLGTPILWVHYGVLFFFVLILLRPEPRWVVIASVVSWGIASTAHIQLADRVPQTWRMALSYALLGLLLAHGWKIRGTVDHASAPTPAASMAA